MKKLILILFSNLFLSQVIPEPKEVNVQPPIIMSEVDSLSEQIRDALQPFFDTEKYGIGFIDYSAVSNYSTTGASFMIYNSSKKTIKYIWFTVAGENPVGDLVPVSKGVYYKTLKAIGPVTSYSIASWSFDYVWFTDIVDSMRISNIKIQFMDGSFKTIKYNKNMYIGEPSYEYAMLVIRKKQKAEIEVENKVANYTADENGVFSEVEFTPEFPGGINAFRNKVSGILDSSAMNSEGIVKTEITFVVEKDGSITDVKGNGKNSDFNSEAVRVVNSIKNKWTPAKINNQTVRYRFRLPLTMNFEK